ncbi:MAG: phenylalanine--tRNA ligase beta subunit-related protein [Elusimicrobia bacterium]|nr:phenylalanine--tRNA ligase beta subunit-related protein [Elusimicrobiota bacterium]
MQIENQVPDLLFVAGVVFARGAAVGPVPGPLAAEIDALVARRTAEEFPADIKESVRRLLKRGGFKAAGRNKPASEYLAQAAREGRFPRINNLVDVNNLLSLETYLPISLLDLAAFAGPVVLRYGRPGEKYVFNSSGQEIELEGLICACSDRPLGNPVKDSMAGKLKDRTRDVVGIIYGGRDVEAGRLMGRHVRRFAELLTKYGGAASVETRVVPADRLLSALV